MDNKVRETFETLFDLFTHPGWEILKNDVIQRRDSYMNQLMTGTNDPNQLLLLKGAIVEANMLIGAEEATKQNFETIEEQEAEELAETP